MGPIADEEPVPILLAGAERAFEVNNSVNSPTRRPSPARSSWSKPDDLWEVTAVSNPVRRWRPLLQPGTLVAGSCDRAVVMPSGG